MHDPLQNASDCPKNRRRAMTESIGRIGRITLTERDSPGSVTGMEAD
jgi:hypothetical protein